MFAALRNFKWRNWLGNRTCEATLYQPDGLDDLCQSVHDSHRQRAVRAVGESYSWSSLVPTPQSLIDLTKLNHVLGIDRAKKTLTVECGMTVADLADTAANNGLTLRSPPIFAKMSLGGALAVGAHGTGQRWATMSDDLLEITLVTPDGTPRTLTRDADGDLFKAAAVGLGALGIMYSVKIQCEPEFHVRMEKGFIAKADVLRNLPDLLATYEFVELYWFLTTDTVWVVRMNRTDAPLDVVSPFEAARNKLRDDAINLFGNALFPTFAKYFPKQMVELLQFIYSVIPPVLVHDTEGAPPRLMASAPAPVGASPTGMPYRGAPIATSETIASLLNNVVNLYSNQVQTASQAFHYIGRYLKSWDSEFSIPIDYTADAWQNVMNIVEGYMARGQFPMNLAMHARFVTPSDALLAPAFGRKSCLLEVVTLDGTPGADLFMAQFHDAMMVYPDARPHWGKVFTEDDAHLAAIRQNYPQMAQFEALRATLDPDGTWLNRFLERLFQRIASPEGAG